MTRAQRSRLSRHAPAVPECTVAGNYAQCGGLRAFQYCRQVCNGRLISLHKVLIMHMHHPALQCSEFKPASHSRCYELPARHPVTMAHRHMTRPRHSPMPPSMEVRLESFLYLSLIPRNPAHSLPPIWPVVLRPPSTTAENLTPIRIHGRGHSRLSPVNPTASSLKVRSSQYASLFLSSLP